MKNEHDHPHGSAHPPAKGGPAHAHAHATPNGGRAFVIGINLSDVLGLALAWAAMFLARKKPTSRRTYGMRGTTILAISRPTRRSRSASRSPAG